MSADKLYEVLTAQSMSALTYFLWGLVIFYVFYRLAGICQRVVLRVCASRNLDEDVSEFFSSAVRVAVIVFGAVTGLGTMGVDVSALVAGLGLTGFAVGFALKDLLSNLMAGLMILIYHPFSRDQHITIGGFSGTVKEIDLRYTTLEGDGNTILLPNSMIFTQGITVSEAGDA